MSDMMIVVEARLETELPGSCTNCKNCAFGREECAQEIDVQLEFHPKEMKILASYQRLLWDVQDLT